MYEFMKSSKTTMLPSTIEGAGLGVFAKEEISAGEIIEVSSVKLFHIDMIDEPVFFESWLIDYAFKWNETHFAIVLGWGSMINHNVNYNTVYEGVPDPLSMMFMTTKRVFPGEELFIRYWHPHMASEVTYDFAQKDIKSAPDAYLQGGNEMLRTKRRRRNRAGTFKDFHRIKNDSSTS